MKNSSHMYTSERVISFSMTWYPLSWAMVTTESLVIPSSTPEANGGVNSLPFLTMKMFSPGPSATVPLVLSIRHSSAPSWVASILARMEFT